MGMLTCKDDQRLVVLALLLLVTLAHKLSSIQTAFLTLRWTTQGFKCKKVV